MKYRIEYKFGGEDWRNLGLEYDIVNLAIEAACKLKPEQWGIVRVVDFEGKVIPSNTSLNEMPDFNKRGDSMVRKEFIYAMLGYPIVQIELDDSQYVEIANKVKRTLDAYKPQVSSEMLALLEEEGVLCHVKYALGRIRAKYSNQTTDGKELVSEAWDNLQKWHENVARKSSLQNR